VSKPDSSQELPAPILIHGAAVADQDLATYRPILCGEATAWHSPPDASRTLPLLI